MSAPTVLVVAKAPVAGQAKTRLGTNVGHEAAADLAAAALLDTLDAAAGTGWPVVVAMTGDLRTAQRADEVRAAIAPHHVVPQRGETFADRLVAAHSEADLGHGVVQVGMDTPQVTAALLVQAGEALTHHDAALGLAEDGGWWVLAVRHGGLATCLAEVPMSTDHTGALTHDALVASGARVAPLPVLADVDTLADAEAVAALVPTSRFALALKAHRTHTDHDETGPAAAADEEVVA
ncbi:TIGR04282 family arsenosugar biosynthesis glycosyltransferase [Solicola sp. PLA-1-18]|uniref:TIGR04282 family arsenosugar biosynthesis glycosyltransferase n=1 Tax=Solicola sp. PLA-1-18 TaxID=3380532 RepID=UPI003B7AEE3D